MYVYMYVCLVNNVHSITNFSKIVMPNRMTLTRLLDYTQTVQGNPETPGPVLYGAAMTSQLHSEIQKVLNIPEHSIQIKK